MYVRSFQPAAGINDKGWFWRGLLHIAAVIGVVLFSMFAVIGLTHTLQAGEGFGAFLSHDFGLLIGMAVTTALSLYLGRPRGPVAFGEGNAIDVESMGLYWHFVDIVWIVIFTAVYLLEYL
jgi:cytochrome o ubiquinol oxidase subunit 3